MKHDDWVIVGRFGRPHGIKGLISVLSFTEPQDNIIHYKDWHVRIKHQWQAITLLHVETTHKFILAQVEGYVEREEVACLTNLDIAVKRAALPALQPGEYYWHQLIGMQVINLNQLSLGRVTEVMATGANDVLVTQGEKRHLIPYLPEQVIKEINRAQGTITVDWDVDF